MKHKDFKQPKRFNTAPIYNEGSLVECEFRGRVFSATVRKINPEYMRVRYTCNGSVEEIPTESIGERVCLKQ